MEQPFNPSPVFEWNYTTDKPIVINQGGTSSGKTYSILQVLLLKTCEYGAKIPNFVTTIAGQDMPNLRDGTVRELDKILNNPFFAAMIKKVNLSTCKYYFHNGAVLEFKSYDNPQDAKNGKRNLLFINEANGLSYEIYKELQMRTTIQTFIDYNPTAPFWVHHELLGKPTAIRFISNYTHNGYIDDNGQFVSNLPQSIIDNIEQYKHDEKDADTWRVYGLGLTGKVSGIVYPFINWISADQMPTIEESKQTVFGLDWGYSNDATTFVRVSLFRGELWIEGLLYKTGLQYCKTKPDQPAGVAEYLLELPYNLTKFDIVADNDNRGIDALKDFRIYCTPADKYAGSVVEGIQAVKSFKLNIVDNKDWKNEQLNYKYKKNKSTNKTKGNEPQKGNDHYFDALRYAVQKIRFKRGGGILATSYKKR